ncbi:MAG TPA: hypothetical protein VFH48_13245 [Chloroflexota bacterium]|nr:hypothetical protein [Chloroflexota bacterium]
MAPVMTAQDRSLIDLSGDSTVQDRSAFVSVAEAARRLGVSTATVKRRIRDGTLEAEPLSRPQGIEYRARLPRDVTVPLAAPASDVSPPLTERSGSEPAALMGSAHVTTQDVSAAITAAIAPLAERLAVQDATIARQAETIASQADAIAELREDRGRLTAELAAAHERIAALAAPQQLVEASTAPEVVDLTSGGMPPRPGGAAGARGWRPAWSLRWSPRRAVRRQPRPSTPECVGWLAPAWIGGVLSSSTIRAGRGR